MNYLGHWLLTHQLLAGQQQLRNARASADKGHSAHQDQQSQSSAGSGLKHDQDMHHVAVADNSQQKQQLPGSGVAQGTRVVMLTSMTHSAGRIKFDDLHAKKSYNGFHRYADAKLAILLGVRQFAKHIDRQAAQTNQITGLFESYMPEPHLAMPSPLVTCLAHRNSSQLQHACFQCSHLSYG